MINLWKACFNSDYIYFLTALVQILNHEPCTTPLMVSHLLLPETWCMSLNEGSYMQYWHIWTPCHIWCSLLRIIMLMLLWFTSLAHFYVSAICLEKLRYNWQYYRCGLSWRIISFLLFSQPCTLENLFSLGTVRWLIYSSSCFIEPFKWDFLAFTL